MCRTPANDGAAVHASSLSFTEAGAAGGLVLLLIHPMGADSHFWDACSVFLQQRHRCIAVDLRGAGGSPASGRPISVDAHARDLAALVAVRGAGKVVPVGCAVGAMVATARVACSAGTAPSAAIVAPPDTPNPNAHTRDERYTSRFAVITNLSVKMSASSRDRPRTGLRSAT